MPDPTTLNLRPIPSSSSSSSSSRKRSRPIPTASALKPWDFSYSPSPDGQDLNLLIMFHGVGDNKTPFFNLGKQLNLPSTAVLSLSAPDPIPLMDHPSFSWYQIFTPDFFPLPESSLNPTKPLGALRRLLETLTTPEEEGGLGWELDEIHLFGWGQGGTVALELGVEIRKPPLARGSGAGEHEAERFGSIVSVSAGLITHPTASLNSPTPVGWFTRHPPQSAAHKSSLARLQRAYREVVVVSPPNSSSKGGGGGGAGDDMPRGKEEWWGIMKFWGQVLKRKQEGWKGSGEVYEVVR